MIENSAFRIWSFSQNQKERVKSIIVFVWGVVRKWNVPKGLVYGRPVLVAQLKAQSSRNYCTWHRMYGTNPNQMHSFCRDRVASWWTVLAKLCRMGSKGSSPERKYLLFIKVPRCPLDFPQQLSWVHQWPHFSL